MIRAILLASVAALAFLVSATGPADGAWICKENCDGNVIEVIDGNTLKVQTREFGPIDIDLALVIIPDLNQRDDDEAKYFLNSMCGPVKQISYNLDLKQSDHSMRKLVAEVWCQGQSINELLVESRYAMLDIEKCGTTDFWDKGWAAECRSSIWGDAQTISDIKCPDNKILLEGPNGRPACVEALSASQFLERGYKIVDTANTEDTYGISMNPVEKTNTFINIESSLTILVAVGILMCILIIFIILLLLKNNQGKERTMKTINKELPSTVEINDYEVEERIAKDPIHSTKESRDILPKEKNAVSLSRAAISPHQHQNKSMQNIKKVKPAKEKTRHDMNPKMKLPTAHMQKHMPNAKKSHVMGGNGAILEAFGGGNRDSQETGVVLTSGNISRKLEDEDNIIDNEWLNPYVEYVDELDKIDKKKKNEESGIGSKKIPSQLAKQKNALECTEKINEMINIYKNKFSDKYIGKWIYINKNMHGYEEQQKFVKMALSTPDFAILEGPPGSGKTTVICELIMQLEKNHKSVLVCSSTHVAVDNILEKLVKKLSYPEDKVFRTGVVSDQTKISKKAQKYTENYAINHITKMNPDLDPKLVPDPDLNNLTKHEKYEKKREVNEEKEQRCEKIHEKISQMNLVFSTTMGISRHVNHFKSDFDVMIIDEASKTTFQEFLVPAIHANRWIIVGDTMQLSPYANTEDVSVVVKNMFEKYDQKILNMLAPKKQNWNQDIGYRLKLEYEQAIVTKNNPLDSKYVKQIERRAPAGYKDLMLKTARSILSVAFPSIMELLLHGNICEPDSSHTKSIFVGGIPSGLIERRRVLLKYQFRMHPDIAEFAKDCFYEGQALNSMQNFENKRKLDYGLFEKRLCWIKVPHILNDEENHEEIDQIFLQLEHFHELDLKKEKNKKWEIGILSFYSNQNMAIQERLSEVTKYSGMEITNGTVDSFQGKEFDIVLVSFSKSNPTQFLNSPNRLNVAITRARYLCILVGNPELLSLAKKRYGENSPLGQLDKIEKYDGMAGYDDLFKNGRLAAEAKKFEVATGWLDRALDKRPGDPDALYRKGLLLVERGLHAEALRCFDSCPKKDGRTLHGKGAILAKLGYHRRAISYYDRALEINPDAANVQTSKDASLADLKKHGREWCKRGDLHKMEAAGPDPTLLLHGRLTSAAMDGKKAMAWCERALGANPDDASALYDKGCLLAWDEIRAGSFATPPGAGYAASPDDSREDALACFDRVLDLAPRDLHAQHNRGALLVMLDRHEEALACFEKVLEAEPDDRPALFCKGYVLDRLGRGGDAVKHFDRVLETLPSHPDVLAKKGHALAWLGRYEEALGCFERLRMAHPDKPLHRLHMTIMLVEMDRIREAIECIGDES